MKEINGEIFKYEQQIKVIVSKYPVYYRDDLSQELYLFLLERMRQDKFQNANSKENYIFICLKHEAARLMVQENKFKFNTLSLDELTEKYNFEVESPMFNEVDGENDEQGNNIIHTNIKSLICDIITEDDYELIYKHYVLKMKQKVLAIKYGVTPQAISKRINKIIKKLRAHLFK